MDIVPLTLTQVNWPVFIKTVQDFLGYSPTRGLDDAKIDLKNPVAFLASLDCENDPNTTLRRAAVNNILSHSFASFIVIIDDADLIIQISAQRFVHIRVKRKGSRFLCIMSGTIREWYDSVIVFCQRETDHILRGLFNKIYEHFKVAGFGPIWHNYNEKLIHDNTFIMEP